MNNVHTKGVAFMRRHDRTMGGLKNLARQNIRLAKRLDAGRSPSALDQLRDLTLNFGFSLATGELLHLNGGWYVTHAALLRLASRKHCAGIRVEQVDQSSDPLAGRWVFNMRFSSTWIALATAPVTDLMPCAKCMGFAMMSFLSLSRGPAIERFPSEPAKPALTSFSLFPFALKSSGLFSPARLENALSNSKDVA